MDYITCTIPRLDYTGVFIIDSNFVKNKLLEAGFDLSKPILHAYDFITDNNIFKQEKGAKDNG